MNLIANKKIYDFVACKNKCTCVCVCVGGGGGGIVSTYTKMSRFFFQGILSYTHFKNSTDN